MVISAEFLAEQYRDDDHREDALHFSLFDQFGADFVRTNLMDELANDHQIHVEAIFEFDNQ